MTERERSRDRVRRRRRWLGFGEVVGLLAVAISALGLWKNWDSGEKPTTVVEQRQPVPLALRGRSAADGRTLEISPVESSHALQSLTIWVAGGKAPIEVGSDGDLSADSVEAALPKDIERSKETRRLPVRIVARYVEMGKDRTSSGNYVLTYRWESGGLFGGRSLRLTGFARA